jgi:hypothetical protein
MFMSEAVLLEEQEDMEEAGEQEFKVEYLGGITAAIKDYNGEKKIIPTGDFDACDAFIDPDTMIRNAFYAPIAKKLVEKFEELKHVQVSKILFIDDLKGTPKRKNNRPIYAKTRKAPALFPELLGIDCVIVFFKKNMEHMSSEQVLAELYTQLRLSVFGDYDLIGFENIISTLGKDWEYTVAQIPDILEDVKWKALPGSQINMFEDGVLPFRKDPK